MLEVLLGALPAYPLRKFVHGLKDVDTLMRAVDDSCGPWSPAAAILLQNLCVECLDPELEQRPSFGEIHAQLMQHKDGNTTALEAFMQAGTAPDASKASSDTRGRLMMF